MWIGENDKAAMCFDIFDRQGVGLPVIHTDNVWNRSGGDVSGAVNLPVNLPAMLRVKLRVNLTV